MIIKHITVKNFGSIGLYDVALTSELNILDTLFTLEMSTAIELILCSKAMPKYQKVCSRCDTLITAEVLLDGNSYYIELKPIYEDELKLRVTDVAGNDVTDFYRYVMSHSWEQDATESFDGLDKSFPLRLCWYKGCDDCEAPKDLHSSSNYIIDTRTFRSHLIRYIKAFEPEPINNIKNYKVGINNKGRFEVVFPGVYGKIPLSETEEKLFLYICFLNVAEFWEDVEKIRDLHHQKKPLLIKNFLEFLDQTTDIHSLILRTMNLKRQVILLTLPMDKQMKNKWIGDNNECREISRT